VLLDFFYLWAEITGVLLPEGRAEMIPIEPDPGNAGEGRMNIIFLLGVISRFFLL